MSSMSKMVRVFESSDEDSDLERLLSQVRRKRAGVFFGRNHRLALWIWSTCVCVCEERNRGERDVAAHGHHFSHCIGAFCNRHLVVISLCIRIVLRRTFVLQ